MLDLPIGANALRSSIPGTNPEVAKVVSNATNLVLDLKALSLLQTHLATVTENARLDSEILFSSPSVFLSKAAEHMKHLVCSYVFTYDDELSPFSESASIQEYLASNTDYEKDPASLLENIETELLVPSIPGNLYYLSVKNNLETYNPFMHAAYTVQKNLYPSKSNIEIITDLIPRYAMPDFYTGPNMIPIELQQRWINLLSLANDTSLQDKLDEFILDGETITVTRQADEVVAIAGLRTAANYKAFMALKYLDTLLDQITFSNASTLISLYQQAGASPYHVDTWLAKLKLMCKGKPNITSLLMDYLMCRRTAEDFTDLWDWLSRVPVVNVPTPGDILVILNSTPTLKAIRDLSINYVAPTGSTGLYYAFLDRFGASITTSDELRLQAFSATFMSWKQQLIESGGVLGAEASVLLACITALDRIKAGAAANQSEEFIADYAADGLRLSSYLSNSAYLKDAFESLVGTS